MIMIIVAKINMAVTPKFETLIASITKLKINAPIRTGIFLKATARIDPRRYTAGKFITVVSRITEIMQSVIKRIVSW